MDDLISRQTMLEMAYDMSEIDGEHFTEPCMVVNVEDIQKLPSVTQKSETVTEFADRCRECGAKYGKLLKQEPCGDAISRQALLDDFGLSEKTRKWGGDHSGYNTMMLYEIQDMIESAPSVNPQHSGDLINRQDAIKAIDEKAKRIKNEDTLNGLAGAVGILFDLPSVTQKSETVTEFADRCRECGAKYGKLLKQEPCGDAISRQTVLDIDFNQIIHTTANPLK